MNSLLSSNQYFLRVRPARPPDIDKDPPETSDVQVELKIVFEVHETYIECSSDGSPRRVGGTAVKSRHERSCTFDLCNFSNQVPASHTILSENLSTFVVDQNYINPTIEKIITLGRKITDRERNTGRNVIPLLVQIRTVQYNFERFYIHRALRESMEEFERRNYGRVPASESASDSLLKRVRVEGAGGDDNEKQESKGRCVSESQINCCICLEQLSVGTYGMAMPCSHVFHADCIMRWLKQSHLCPLCRHEMPTANES